MNQDARGLQVEGPPERAWQATRTWYSLLGHLCPGSHMANCSPFPYSVHYTGLAEPPA